MKKIILLSWILLVFVFSCQGPQAKKEMHSQKKAEDLPAQERQLLTKTFIYEGSAESVYLAGNFNQWQVNDPAYAFQRKKETLWELVVPETRLIRGENQYKLIVNGQWILDSRAGQIKTTPLAGQVGVFLFP